LVIARLMVSRKGEDRRETTKKMSPRIERHPALLATGSNAADVWPHPVRFSHILNPAAELTVIFWSHLWRFCVDCPVVGRFVGFFSDQQGCRVHFDYLPSILVELGAASTRVISLNLILFLEYGL
jgi:hypothetical protein